MPEPEPVDFDLARHRLGGALRDLRVRREWTQSDLAKITGISVPTISAYELGRRKAPLEELVLICDAYDLLLTELLDGLYPYGSRTQE